MLTFQTTPQAEAKIAAMREKDLESALRRLSSSLTRSAAETANAFFSANTTPGVIWEARELDLESLQCSQKNIGETHEMTCDLGVKKSDWTRMFTLEETEQFKMDAFCEMANCICGAVLADPGFSDEFGYMIPCVPCSGPSLAMPGSRTLRGAFRLSGILVHFSFAVRETAAINPMTDPLSAAA